MTKVNRPYPTAKRTTQWLTRKLLVPALLPCLASSLTVCAQSTSNTNIMDPEFVKKLIQRMDELEKKSKRVDELEAKVQSLKSGAPSMADIAPATIKETWPKISIAVQGDTDFQVSDDKGSHNTFLLGDLNPLITAKLSEKSQIVTDLVIASDTDDGFSLEVERLFAEYDFNDHFHVQMGRVNTAIGYYNNVYHNGTYFQTTVDRPLVYDFEDGGGILPVHGTGISVNGDIPSGKWGLHYVAEVLNGRSYDQNLPVFQVEDNNGYKAFNVNLSAKPEWAPGWQFGTSFYHDTVTPEDVAKTDQMIFTGYLVYKTPKFEWLTEGVFMRDTPSGDHAHWTPAGYTMVSRKFGKFRPYLRLEWQNSPAGDPLLEVIGANTSNFGPTVGVRYDFSQMMAVKLEYEHLERRDLDPLNQFTAQWTFRF